MPVAEIIAIGTELLLGEIQDTNTQYLAKTIRDIGIDIYRSMIVGDNAERIAQAIREAMGRAQIILTTGGLGPTVDDPTRQAVALAMGLDIEFRPELWEQIEARFVRFNRKATENNRRQAFVPRGSIAIENQVGTAPAFIVETDKHAIISMPGVPREMEYLMQNTFVPYLKNRFDLHGTIKARVLHASAVGESQVDEWIGDLETYNNPTVGLLAHPGIIDIRITAKANSIEEANQLIEKMEKTIRDRIGDYIYGCDSDTLEGSAYQVVTQKGWHLVVLECGLAGNLVSRLSSQGLPSEYYEIHSDTCEDQNLNNSLLILKKRSNAEVALGANLKPGAEKQTLTLLIITPGGKKEVVRSYGGPPAHGPLWGVNMALDFLRRNI